MRTKRRVREEDRVCYVCARRLMTTHGTFHGTTYYRYPEEAPTRTSPKWGLILHDECMDFITGGGPADKEEAGDGV